MRSRARDPNPRALSRPCGRLLRAVRGPVICVRAAVGGSWGSGHWHSPPWRPARSEGPPTCVSASCGGSWVHGAPDTSVAAYARPLTECAALLCEVPGFGHSRPPARASRGRSGGTARSCAALRGRRHRRLRPGRRAVRRELGRRVLAQSAHRAAAQRAPWGPLTCVRARVAVVGAAGTNGSVRCARVRPARAARPAPAPQV
jgi:hypothetical protein